MKRLLVLVLAVGTLGCSAAAKAVRTNYAGFNETIQYNNSQQMLLNLVRLKYRDTPLFLKVGALSTSYSMGGSVELSAGRVSNHSLLGAEMGGSFSVQPTITYTPLEGETYVKQVLTEVDTTTFALLFRSGWPMRTLSHIMLESIGDYMNNADEPSYPQFNVMVEVLHQARKEGRLELVKDDDRVGIEILTDRTELLSEERTGEMRRLFMPVEDFQLRSFLDIMFFLGKNTEVPESQQDQVKPGNVNGWMNIRSSPGRPSDALVWVKYNGYYFSIARNDIRSKDSFALLKLLFQLQAGDVETIAPILTLPVASP
jgi:hypothetical protein